VKQQTSEAKMNGKKAKWSEAVEAKQKSKEKLLNQNNLGSGIWDTRSRIQDRKNPEFGIRDETSFFRNENCEAKKLFLERNE
jgi:hypothetical protein